MKTFIFLTTLFLVVALLLVPSSVFSAGKKKQKKPVPVTQQTTTEWRIVGYTSTETDGGVIHPNGSSGYHAMHQYCQEEVAANARACYASEVSRPPLATGTDRAWVIHSRDVALLQQNNGEFLAIDTGSGQISGTTSIFGTTELANLDCADHLFDSGFSGQTVSQDSGSIGLPFTCDNVFPIACCAPVAIPVTLLP